MSSLVEVPNVVTAAESEPKRIEEPAGRINSAHQKVSIARMVSPGGWEAAPIAWIMIVNAHDFTLPDQLESRLNRIATQWMMLAQAHRGDLDQQRAGLASQRERYRGAAYRNLMAILRAADDPAGVGAPVGESDAAFDECWQTELLARAWRALSDDETTSGSPYYTVLKCRSKNPAASVSELAAAVNRQRSGATPLSVPDLRQLLHRARQQFADLLIAEIEQELAEVRLLPYCRIAVNHRRDERDRRAE